MAAVIQVRESVLQQLDILKKKIGVNTYDEILEILINNAKNLQKSHFGTLPKLKTFKRESLDRFD
jgi:hypothetical protein